MMLKKLGSNVYEIRRSEGYYLVSHETVIAYKSIYGQIGLKVGQPQSVTTARHLNKWLGYSWKEGLKDGSIKFTDYEF